METSNERYSEDTRRLSAEQDAGLATAGGAFGHASRASHSVERRTNLKPAPPLTLYQPPPHPPTFLTLSLSLSIHHPPLPSHSGSACDDHPRFNRPWIGLVLFATRQFLWRRFFFLFFFFFYGGHPSPSDSLFCFTQRSRTGNSFFFFGAFLLINGFYNEWMEVTTEMSPLMAVLWKRKKRIIVKIARKRRKEKKTTTDSNGPRFPFATANGVTRVSAVALVRFHGRFFKRFRTKKHKQQGNKKNLFHSFQRWTFERTESTQPTDIQFQPF